jgi:hypothetical protein
VNPLEVVDDVGGPPDAPLRVAKVLYSDVRIQSAIETIAERPPAFSEEQRGRVAPSGRRISRIVWYHLASSKRSWMVTVDPRPGSRAASVELTRDSASWTDCSDPEPLADHHPAIHPDPGSY